MSLGVIFVPFSEKVTCNIINFDNILQVRKVNAQLATLGINDSEAKTTEIRISKMIMTIVGIFVFCNSFQVVASSAVDLGGYTFKGKVEMKKHIVVG